MAPCRQLLIWSVPSIAVLLGIFWFRRKRELAKSDPGGRDKIRSLQEELAEVLKAEVEASKHNGSARSDNRIVAKSSPIDIQLNGTNSQRSSLELTDEEVDIEIEKIIRKKSLERDSKSLSVGTEKNNIMREPTKHVAATFSAPVLSHTSASCAEKKLTCDVFPEDAPRVEVTETSTCAALGPLRADPPPQRDRTDAPPSPLPDAECTRVSAQDLTEEVNNNEDDIQEKNNSTVSENDKCPVEQARRSSERDSANHSPADAMLASPSMCHFSDNHSEGSSDSGKGCSEAASPPPANISLAQSPDGLRIHQFLIPQALVGLLIGKQGAFVTLVKAKTGANIFVRRHPDSLKLKICAVEGTQSEIEAAVDMIKRKFPEKRFPHFSLQEINADLYQRLIPVVPEFLQLQLVESVNNETIMTCLVSAGHFFLQQPLHPTFPSLQALHRLMAATYQCPDVPALPRPIKEGSICAAPTENNWYRAQVVSTSEETDTSVVKLVDFGGYLTLDNGLLKQIRSDFMTLPFQATEALLAFVKPANGAEEWCGEALRIMAALTAGQLLHAQVAGYDECGVPLTHLYLTIGAQQVIFLNSELVERGLAEWDLPQES